MRRIDRHTRAPGSRTVWGAMTPTRSEPGAPIGQPWTRVAASAPSSAGTVASRTRMERVEAQRIVDRHQAQGDICDEQLAWAKSVLGTRARLLGGAA